MDLDRDLSFADLRRLVEELERLQATGQDESVIAFCTNALTLLPSLLDSSTLRGPLHDALGMALLGELAARTSLKSSNTCATAQLWLRLSQSCAHGVCCNWGWLITTAPAAIADTHIALAVKAYEEAEALAARTDPSLRAFIQSNLASALAAQAAGIQVGPDQDAHLRRAQDLCRAALGVLTRENASWTSGPRRWSRWANWSPRRATAAPTKPSRFSAR